MYNELVKLRYWIKNLVFFYLLVFGSKVQISESIRVTITQVEAYLDLEQASHIFQWILQEESHTIDLLSIQIYKYENHTSKIQLLSSSHATVHCRLSKMRDAKKSNWAEIKREIDRAWGQKPN